MKAYVGTSGFSYSEWKGSFYPEKLPNKEMLSFYSDQLPSVEINNTFYRLPRKNVLEGWTAQTPPHFRFSIKASRRITHFKKLKDCEDLLTYLFTGLQALGERMGPILFQLPPTMRADAGLLRDFLQVSREVFEKAREAHAAPEVAYLPSFEFRHPSWFDDEIYRCLSDEHAALVSGDLDESEKDPPLVRTADFSYLRLRKTKYEPGDLEAWAERLVGLGVREIFAYFKHEEIGPELAAELEALLTASPKSV
jgi:uncharacterized protein YecE (DUF72 family)